MEKVVSSVCKLSHKQFRALLKKFRRKKIRQKIAKEREDLELLEQQRRENSPNYKERQEEIRRNTELYEQFEEKERIRKHKLWLLREAQAQEEFKRKQNQIELERIKREEERKRILEEFEKQEYVVKQAEEENKKIKSQKEVVNWDLYPYSWCWYQISLLGNLQYEALQEALSNLSEADGPWHNPIAPENYIAVGQEREQCMFFSKTGCCRFGERCSRGHTRPSVSSTILIRGMYSHFSIDQTGRDDYDTDIALEYEDKECYQDFKNFYKDVLPEFKKFGTVVQFKVCNNFEPHLRGNVYVQYSREEEAMEAYKNFNGRYYAGKQITCDFTHVIRWRSAICGLHGRNLCPKGINCNFLHVFKNPHDEFWEADRDIVPRKKHHGSESSRKNHSRDDRYDHHSSEHKYRNSSRSGRHESRSERHESRSDRYEPRSDRYEGRNDRYSSRNERHESRSERYDYSESKHSRNDSKDGNVRSSGSSSDTSDENYSSKPKKLRKNGDSQSSKHRKRSKNSSSRSRSNSPSDNTSHRKHSHKKKKHKKKKSKKSEKMDSGDSSVE